MIRVLVGILDARMIRHQTITNRGEKMIFDDLDWENVWASILAGAVIGALILVGIVSFSPKNVDYYYLSHPSEVGGGCVYAHWTWHSDEKVFCSASKDEVLDFYTKANLNMHK